MRLRHKARLVRLHLVEPFPSLEGIGGQRINGHYVLLRPKLLRGEGDSYSLEGELEVPAERVIFVQVLGDGREGGA